ncbi:hypothetical protein PIB30_013349 [Stylosanthes scabra]|uniref:Uncharacterized protein n=1 Tax=Stylosanthes scabra TaxID=79078 RepID=A0ABU6U591_9FABA|nr:hypothetical protein [Stylosanthes scabra]
MEEDAFEREIEFPILEEQSCNDLYHVVHVIKAQVQSLFPDFDVSVLDPNKGYPKGFHEKSKLGNVADKTRSNGVRSLRHGFTTVITGKSALAPGDNGFLKSSFSPSSWIADSNAK